ncbi:MAG: glycosyltransferase [Actinomycetota bacterium]|nr:glycosyltransferase [Actinomycetota bacterium]
MREVLVDVLVSMEHWSLYRAALLFVAGYPLLAAVVWVVTALLFYVRRERRGSEVALPAEPADLPTVTVLVPAYNEQTNILETVETCLEIDYPDFEVLVVDDGSSDATRELLEPSVAAGRIRLLAKEVNEGKALALNDGLLVAHGEIAVIIDADARPDPQVLRVMIGHFTSSPRVAAVTGNPRVVERHNFLTRLQTVEFTAIVSLLRRAQRVWGRIVTVSGVVTAVRVSAVFDVGGFSHDMDTEDIDLTWKLQRRFYDVRYEPRALVWMRVPTTLRGLWRQRSRWARGLAQVLRVHGPSVIGSYRARRLWPTLIEAVCSVLWAYMFTVLTLIWVAALVLGAPLEAVSPFPALWGMVIATVAIVQLSVGALLDSHYERSIYASLGYVVFYPLVYWILMSVVTVVNTPRALLGRRAEVARWHTVRGT